MSCYQHPTITSYPSFQATIYEASIIRGSSNRIAGNSRKHLLSSYVENNQPVTMHWQKQFLASEPNGLNFESDDNQPILLQCRKELIPSESDDNKPYVICLDLLSFLMRQVASFHSSVYDVP